MRQILFRGFNRKNNKWLYGYYLVNRGLHFICPEGVQNPLASWEDFVVEKESVGQVIQWEENRQGFNTPSWGYMDRTHYYNVIGNIYENKELLEDEE